MSEDKAAKLVEEAKRKVASAESFLGGIFGGTQKLEDASDMFSRAGNAYKMAKAWDKAGAAFVEVANLQNRLQSRHECASQLVEAANCYKKCNVDEAISCLTRAIEIFTDMGRFNIAAKHHMAIAELYETQDANIKEAIQHYEQAADYYRGEESTSSANKCLLKVAHFCAQLEQYEQAIEIYEQCATTALDNTLLKWSAKDYLFKASILNMCVDPLRGAGALDKYQGLYPAFNDSREGKFVQTLLSAHEEQDVEAFTAAVKEYDSISRLDPWLTSMLLRVKRSFLDGEPDLK
eukprot:scpid73375/ scgid26800/ Alpha-soluble NSF attachment protein; N-ethylmaleimide-sensitive factor attachment protein alpha